MKNSEKRKIAVLIGVFIIIGIIYCFYTKNSGKKLWHPKYHGNALTQNSKCMFTSASGYSEKSRVNYKNIGIFAMDKSELLEEFGKALALRLQQQYSAGRIVFYPYEQNTDKDNIFPDQCFFIFQEKIYDNTIPYCLTLKSAIRIWGGNSFTRHFYYGKPVRYCFLPETQHDMTGLLETEAVGYNFSIGKSKYNLLATEMSKSVAENIVKEFKKHTAPKGTMPDIPESLYPMAVAFPELPFANLGEFKLICHGRRPFANKAAWYVEIKGEKDELLQSIKNRLATSGWRTDLANDRVSGTKGNERIEIYELQSFDMPIINHVASTDSPSFVNVVNIPPATTFFVIWEKLMTKKTASALFEPLMKNQQISLLLLVMLSENMTYEQQQQVMKRVETSPESLDSAAWISLSKIAKDKNKAKEYVLKAKSTAYLEVDNISKQTAINAKLKKLGVKNPELLVPSKEDFRKLGIIALENTGKMQVEGKLNLPLMFYFYDKNKKLAFIRLTVRKSLKNAEKYKLHLRENHDAGSSFQENDPAESCGTATARFKINSIDGDKVKIEVTIPHINRRKPPQPLTVKRSRND